MGFYVGGKESALGWTEILLDLYEKGVKKILVGVSDGLPTLEDAMKEVYPKADVPRCVVHKVRNALNATRKKINQPWWKSTSQSNKIVRATTRTSKPSKKPEKRSAQSWEQGLGVLLTCLQYPSSIMPMIYTTNIIEWTRKEIKERTKTMNSLPTEKAAEKIVYLQSVEYNDRWAQH
jgi:putative transposase